jgi:hypothetical protein
MFAPITVAQAQSGKLTGLVTDAETGKPIEGVSVVVQGTTLGQTTNAAGKYFIIQVPPGTYTVQARRLGYQSVSATNVQITIDGTREQNFKLKASNQSLAAMVVQADQTPLIERTQVGSSSVVTAEQIQSLPVTSIAGVLALQQGFTEVPNNTSVISLAEEQRSTTQPIRVRGGRGGSTLSMIDGIPINNPLFGSDVVSLNPLAVQQVNFQRGGMDPQYGNALSGVINQAVREGGSEVSGSINFQNSTLPGALFGNEQDKLLGLNLLNGYLSGPVPGTNAKIRYAVSGQVQSQSARVLRFDQDKFTANAPVVQTDALPPSQRDLNGGWQGYGGNQNSQVVGKLTFLPFNNTTFKVTAVQAERATRNYDRRLYYNYRGDPLKLVNNRADSLNILTDGGNRFSQDMMQPSVSDKGRVIIGSLEQRFGRSNLQVRVGQTTFERTTCPYFLGTCIPGPFFRPNFDQNFLSPSPGVAGGDRIPDAGIVDGVYGGENFTTRTFKADVQSQLTDHNNLQFGAQFVQHDLKYKDVGAFGSNSGIQPLTSQVYRAKPIEAAGYVQSVIEYDFITIKLGGRFDYGVAKGLGFTDPFNPSNNTSAREVCDGATVGGKKLVNAQGQPYGVAGCAAGAINKKTQRSVLLDSAAAIAQLDDFTEAKARTAFSPRVAIAFPLTEKSQVFFNAGRYTMVPLYGNGYRNTGIGTVAGAGDNYCAATATKPGTNECVPNISTNNPAFVGNPGLLLEQAKQYEVGYQTELNRNYSIQVAVFNRSETGLSGLRPSRSTQDIGSTYDGSLPSYTVLVNGDFLTSRGMEVQFRRRLADRWGYDVNFGLSRATTNSRPPDRANEVQRTDESNRQQLVETVADIDQTYRMNTSFFLQVREDIPSLPMNAGRLLRNSRATITFNRTAGIPYTPVRASSFGSVGTFGNAADINAGRQPATSQFDLLLDKGFRIGSVRYSGFLRVANLFDRANCVQVFVNTGTCDNGLRDFNNRRVGNTGDASTSTAFDQPEYIGARRSLATGITVNF